MRVVCPHTGSPHPDTVAALDRWPGPVDYRDVSGDEQAYSRLLCELWRDGEDFLVCEHDIVPGPGDLAHMAMCPFPYCAAPYTWGQAVGVALGFTRFRSILTRVYPDAAEIASRVPSNFGAPGHWRQLDVWLQAAVLRDLYGWQPHAHARVEHRNWQDTPSSAPLRLRVEGRCYLPDGLVARLASDVRGRQ